MHECNPAEFKGAVKQPVRVCAGSHQVRRQIAQYCYLGPQLQQTHLPAQGHLYQFDNTQIFVSSSTIII